MWGELQPRFDPERDGAALERVLARVSKMPGVARIVRPGEFAGLGYPEYEENHFVPGQYLIAGTIDTQLVLDPTAPAVRRARARADHGHGYFPEAREMHAALVLSGRSAEKKQP